MMSPLPSGERVRVRGYSKKSLIPKLYETIVFSYYHPHTAGHVLSVPFLCYSSSFRAVEYLLHKGNWINLTTLLEILFRSILPENLLADDQDCRYCDDTLFTVLLPRFLLYFRINREKEILLHITGDPATDDQCSSKNLCLVSHFGKVWNDQQHFESGRVDEQTDKISLY